MCVLNSILGVSRFSACTRRDEMSAALCRPRWQLRLQSNAYVPTFHAMRLSIRTLARRLSDVAGWCLPSFLRPMWRNEQMCYNQAPLML
jgi:hypothetical protein